MSWKNRRSAATSRVVRRSRRCLPLVDSLERREVLTTLPSGFTETVLADNLAGAALLATAADGSVFVGSLNGAIRVIPAGSSTPQWFGQVTTSARTGQGLIGLALDPNYESNHWVYVLRTVDSGNGFRNVLSRVTASGNTLKSGSQVDLFATPAYTYRPNAPHHNGGQIAFGADGKIYIPTGDRGTSANAQSLRSFAGKILRLNKDGSIPRDNPYFRVLPGKLRSIYAVGLRNPYSIAAKPGTNVLYVNDVGETSYEEINRVQARANYGWPRSEGPAGIRRGITKPLYSYSHRSSDVFPGDIAIVGGTFYNVAQPQFPASYRGLYFFADFHAGWIKTYDPSTGKVSGFESGLPPGIVALDHTSDGRLIYLILNTSTGQSELRQVAYQPTSAPAVPALASQTIALGQSATFTAEPTGATPVGYQWYVNGNPIAGATGVTYALPGDYSLNGVQVHYVASNAYGSTASNDATLSVLNVAPPQVSITTPANLGSYRVNSVLRFSGTAVDPSGGLLTASSYVWTFDLIRGGIEQKAVRQATGLTGAFRIPKYSNGAFAMRVNLTVTSAAGASTTLSRLFVVRV